MIIPWTLLKEYGKGKNSPRKKTPEVITSSRILVHLLLVLYDPFTCALLFLVPFGYCRWNYIYSPWINQRCFGMSQKKIHPFFNLAWAYLHWEYGSATSHTDECVRLTTTENTLDENFVNLRLKDDHFLFPYLHAFSDPVSAESHDSLFPVVIHTDFKSLKRNKMG